MDELAKAIGAAYDEVSKETPDAGEASTTERVEPQVDKGTGADETTAEQRARDDAGRFAKADKADGKDKPRETLTLKKGEKVDAKAQPERAQAQSKDAAAKDALPVSGKHDANQPGSGTANGNAVQPADQNQSQQVQPVQPPEHWKGGAKVDWNKLPAAVRDSIFEDHKALAPLRGLTPALDHFAPQLTQRFGDVTRGVGAILNTWSNATSTQEGAIAFLRDFCQQYRIDPQNLVAGNTSQVHADNGAEQQAVDQGDPRFQRIEAQLQALAQQPLIAQQQFQQHQIQTDIQSFASSVAQDGSLAHPYFNDVREHMGALMQTREFTNLVQTKGGPAALNEAYDRAVYANPQIRQNLLAQNEQRQVQERKRAAETAKAAGVSIAGAPGGSGNRMPQNETIAQSLNAAYDAVTSGRRV